MEDIAKKIAESSPCRACAEWVAVVQQRISAKSPLDVPVAFDQHQVPWLSGPLLMARHFISIRSITRPHRLHTAMRDLLRAHRLRLGRHSSRRAAAKPGWRRASTRSSELRSPTPRLVVVLTRSRTREDLCHLSANGRASRAAYADCAIAPRTP